MKRLFVGPWYGEFGLEVVWAAGARHAVTHGGYDEVVVCSWPGHEFLYSDFATAFVPHGIECVPCGCKAVRGNRRLEVDAYRFVAPYLPCNVFPPVGPMMQGEHPGNTFREIENRTEFIRYGEQRKEFAGALVLHPRARMDWGAERNWSASQWKQLAEKLGKHRLIVIGTRNAAYAVPGAEDMRGVPLDQLADVLASCRLVVGPSSGPMHFAALCGAPMLVWVGYGGEKLEILVNRYTTAWNPHLSPVWVLPKEDWNPSVDMVADAVESALAPQVLVPKHAVDGCVGIGVIGYKRVNDVARCVHSIRRNTRVEYQLAVLDNSEYDWEISDWVKQHAPEAALFHPNPQLGCSRGRNLLYHYFLTQGCGSFVVIDCDVEVVGHGWVEDMLEALKSKPDSGIVGWDVANILDRTVGPAGEIVEIPGMCQIHRMRAMQDVAKRFPLGGEGPWHEGFHPIHSFDTHLCLRARKAGWKTYLVQGKCKIRHENPHSGVSLLANRNALNHESSQLLSNLRRQEHLMET